MTVLLEFRVDGNPVAKARPRIGRGRGYTPAATVHAEQLVAWHAAAAGARHPLADRLTVDLEFCLATNRRRTDLDNLAKLVLDALNGLVWLDDSQIDQLNLTKRIDRDDPHTVVRVRTT